MSSDAHETPTPLHGRAGFALSWLIWWVLSTGLWLVFAGTVARPEVLSAVAVGAIAATAAIILRDEGEVGARPSWRAFVRLWRPVAAWPRDLARLVTVLAAELLRRDRRGAFFAVPLDTSDHDERHAAARRVAAPAAGSLAPNTYVVGIDTEAGLMLVHQLVPTSRPRADADPLELT